MIKSVFLAGLSLVVLNSITAHAYEVETKTSGIRARARHSDGKISPEEIVAFAKFSYSLDREQWTEEDMEIFYNLINDGWRLDPFKGTTGASDKQVESISGLLAFKEDQVVISTRGTVSSDDWITNLRFSSNHTSRLFPTEAEKLSAITAQFFHGVSGEITNGFLQTHLSSWDYIKDSILQHAKAIGKSPSELNYTITGHSQGAAKAQLNTLHLLSDPDLGVGVETLEESFTVNDLGIDDF